MSLRVWLPLTKDLRNQGLDNIGVTNNGATYSASGGKLGGCYSFGNGSASSKGLFLNSNLVDLMQEEYSVAVWVKPLGNHYHYNGTILSSGNWNGTCYAFGLSQDNSQVDILCRGYNIYITCAVPTNTWTHLVCTCDSNNIVRLYKNGEYIGSSSRNNKPASDNTTQACIGRETYADGYFTFNGMLNDFRLYDHCLSPMEVKELAKGLVLHYPLNRNGWGQENLLPVSGSTIINSTQSFEFQGWVQNFYTKTWMNEHLTPGKQYTLSYTVTCLSIPDSTYTFKENRASPILVHQGGGWGQITTTSDGIKDTNMSVGQSRDYKCTFTFATATENYEYYGLCGYTALYRNSSNNTQYAKFRIDNLKLEEGSIPTPWCPNSADTLAGTIGLNGTTEYDCSGFCNNGIKNNSPTYSSDTAKYTVSTHVDGVNQTIQLPNLLTLIPDSIFTFNIWFKRLQSEPSSKPWETLFGGPSGFEIETCSANNVHDNKIRAYSWGSGMFEFEFDKWNMLTMVSNGTNALFYLNGELKLTGTYKALVSGNYFLGSWRDTSTQNYKGYLSDARIYATALSADDVLSLYQNNAYIDSNGNVYGAVHSEV